MTRPRSALLLLLLATLLLGGTGCKKRNKKYGTVIGAQTSATTTPASTRGMNLTAAELEILARIVKGETPASAPYDGQVAVAAVVLNRVRDPRFPDTVEAVAHQPNQFDCYSPQNRATLYDGPIPAFAMRAAQDAAAGADPSQGALYFFNPYKVQPSWAASLTFCVRIGTGPTDTHDFYK